jgi:hypothetical protein
MSYKIVRYYFDRRPQVLARGFTLEEAQAHCQDPETSSRTARSAIARRRTARIGAWFDGYVGERAR